MHATYFTLVLTLILAPTGSQGSDVAMFSVFGSRSQKEMYYGIAEALIRRGHSVTFYTAFTAHRNITGLKEMHLKGMEKTLEAMTEGSVFDDKGPLKMADAYEEWSNLMSTICETILSNEHLQALIKSNKKVFDVSLVDIWSIDCVLPVAEHSSKYMMQTSTSELFADFKWQFDIPTVPSVSPHWMSEDFNPKMDFWRRMQNIYLQMKFIYLAYFKTLPDMNKAVQKIMPGLKSIEEVRKLVSMILVNSNPSTTGEVLPTADLVKNIAGVHIQDKIEKLPKDIDDFINGAGDAGFIYISFGTIVPENQMPKHAKKALIEAFSKIQQRVIWKFREEIPGLSPNVKIVKWAPQQALLAHPKIKTFITHGGLFGFIETINFGVPCIGLPVFADQPANAQKMVREGMGIELIWEDLNPDVLLDALNSIVNDTSYKENAVRQRNIFRDRLVSAKDEAAYWIEYVIRHEGPTHLRIRTDHLNLFQYLLLDVFALVGAVGLFVIYVTYRLVLAICCCSRCCSSSQQKKKLKLN